MSNEINLRTAKSGDTLLGLIQEKLTAENGGKSVHVNSVWNEILDVVDEQQKETGDVYSGGKERTNWSKNYKIFVGNTITFTKELWNKIRSLVGLQNLDDTATTSLVPDEPVGTESTSTSRPEVTPPPLKKEAPVPVVPKPIDVPTSTDIPDDSLPEYDIKLMNQRRTDLAGKAVMDKQGRKLMYDNSGFLREIQAGGQNIIVNRDESGNILDMSTIVYDANHHATQDVHRDAKGKLQFYQDKQYEADGSQHAFTRNAFGELQGIETRLYKDNDHYLIIDRNNDGSVSQYEEHIYNTQDGFSMYIKRDSMGNIIEWTEDNMNMLIVRDSEGNLISYTDTSTDVGTWTTYDPKGRELSGITYHTMPVRAYVYKDWRPTELPNGVQDVFRPDIIRTSAQIDQFMTVTNDAKDILINNASALGLTKQEIELVKNLKFESISEGISRYDRDANAIFFNVNETISGQLNMYDSNNFAKLILHELKHATDGNPQGSSINEERMCETRAIEDMLKLVECGIIKDFNIPGELDSIPISSLSTQEKIKEYVKIWSKRYEGKLPLERSN